MRHLALAASAVALALAGSLAPGRCTQDPGSDPRPPPEAAPAPRPNFVLLTLDTLRADRLSCYGWYRKTSPFIDSLAEESLLFERCYATISHTTPSHASLLTSVLPLEHGITQNSWTTPTEMQRSRALVTTAQLRSYAQILADHGFATGGFVSAATARRITGLAAGFQTWSEPAEEAERRPGSETIADAKAWLETVKERPFFAWIHLFDVHGPHEKGERYADEFPNDKAFRDELRKRGVPDTITGRRSQKERSPFGVNAAYDAAIRRTDDLVAELVAALRASGAWERTTFVLTSDHGEGLGEHDFLGHALAWGEQLHVPLIVRVPGRAGERLDPVISGIDVLPTVLDLVPGLPRDELLAQASGTSVVAPAFRELPIFGMAAGEKELALITRRWKLVRRETGDALYDLQSDPFELKDVKAEHPKEAEALAAQLELSLAAQDRRRQWLREGGVEPTLTPEQEQRLRVSLEALGYGK